MKRSVRTSVLLRPLAVVVLLAGPVLAQQWVADASKSSIPNSAATGKVHGKRFVPTAVEVETSGAKAGEVRATYYVNFREGNDPMNSAEYSITLAVKAGETLAGKTFTQDAQGKSTPAAVKEGNATYPAVQGVMMSWPQPGKHFHDTDMMSKSTLRLEFGKPAGNKLPGKVYISTNDAAKSFVCGKFVAVTKKILRLVAPAGKLPH